MDRDNGTLTILCAYRRVRTNPGGDSSLANFWEPAEAEDFKPTRRYVLLFVVDGTETVNASRWIS